MSTFAHKHSLTCLKTKNGTLVCKLDKINRPSSTKKISHFKSPHLSKVHETERYTRIRLHPPTEFQPGSFRTIDPGRPGHTKLVIGRPVGSKKTRAQAILIERATNPGYPKLGPRGQKLASKYISEEVRANKYPGEQAIAIGISRARREVGGK